MATSRPGTNSTVRPELGDTAAILAPAAETQASLFAT
jgi:hypothetical protein